MQYFYQEYGSFPVPLELSTAGTVEAWVKPSGVGGARTAVGYHSIIRIGTNGTKYTVWLSGIGFKDGPAVSVGSWAHMVLTFTYGGTFDFWINGVKAQTAETFVATHSSQRAWFIGDIQSSAWPFGGSIDTVRFFNRVLTDDEVLRNYRSGLRFHS